MRWFVDGAPLVNFLAHACEYTIWPTTLHHEALAVGRERAAEATLVCPSSVSSSAPVAASQSRAV
eukprot:CAMPEP_0184248186 /NCGR_PEP_ID=MMETSP0977-20130417/2993_1 /TAXON_ID=483370 /ORGANISM="non described non described, Strain CCMP2097" /LENGTH=64 /DNA_ID=CAMNT_0026553535 /DNA_START=48 /DNA_END=239 /DNA_ORIENTATION=-